MAGTCPACGGWITAPSLLQPMPSSAVESKRPHRPRFEPHGSTTFRVRSGGQSRGVGPDLIWDSAYESRKEMRGFYRFLAAIGVAVTLCLAMIYALSRQ